ncbi:sigma-70 family RNA polymerase sigma factor [Ideonella sp. 4Y11]|uniref:Sigma-70 family RNA polymerase sigma factor n=1 Tax=Ideonella aquatica TaxID=2824119 RepID=A0A941BJG3_9BURK|nr:sigma-70 family RNA polymerase sigma factor [Ideonella aquatica]MBQ0958843.1 sigma-70 family RNA polymerase sigma factor [Ideonella aquatica]
MSGPLDAALAAIWRIESARVVATVARRVHDLGVAEELAQDAWLEALQRWPTDGLPDKPGAWLMTTAQRKALDWLRHRQMAAGHEAALAEDLIAMQADRHPDHADTLDARRAARSVGDDELLRLLFTACHPVLPPPQRVALTLKVLAGLSTAEIARAFLVSEPTMAQRLVRAKRTLAEARIPCELPRGTALAARLGSVLEVVYLVFNEGYTATAGEDWMRPALCDEALRLGRMLVQLAPAEPEAWGLLALMSLQASRIAARTEADGRPILLAEQDRRRWDRLLIRHGLEALARADALAPASPDSYQLQAALAACHARAARAEDTDWALVCALYERLRQRSPSPVVALNHAVAVGMHQGPAAALVMVEALQHEPALAAYPWLPAVQGDLLARLGRRGEARQAWLRAAALSTNQRERQSLQQRAEALEPPRSTRSTDEPA